jgi:hypothetical protein
MKEVMHYQVSKNFFLKSGRISLDEELGNLVESSLNNQANLRVLTNLP